MKKTALLCACSASLFMLTVSCKTPQLAVVAPQEKTSCGCAEKPKCGCKHGDKESCTDKECKDHA